LHRIRFVGPTRAQSVVSVSEQRSGLPQVRVAGHIEHASRRLKDWLVAEAHRDLRVRVAWHARQMGVRARRISLRDQTSRWGSCSANGFLSFSWRLIFAPSYVLDYVAAHEVAHLREMNHGPRFWSLVERSVPHLERAKRWLRQEGADLHRYDVELAASGNNL
jgi:hypothetical protein